MSNFVEAVRSVSRWKSFAFRENNENLQYISLRGKELEKYVKILWKFDIKNEIQTDKMRQLSSKKIPDMVN